MLSKAVTGNDMYMSDACHFRCGIARNGVLDNSGGGIRASQRCIISFAANLSDWLGIDMVILYVIVCESGRLAPCWQQARCWRMPAMMEPVHEQMELQVFACAQKVSTSICFGASCLKP